MTDNRSYTVWNRLEPLAHDEELTGTLRGELADPLWLLARQRQFGEFAGEDAGSPVSTHVEYYQDPVTRVEVGAETLDYDSTTDAPVETLVEREMVAAEATRADEPDFAPNYAVRAEAGMHFLDRLRRAVDAHPGGGSVPGPDRFDPAYHLGEPEVADAETRRFVDVFDAGDGEARGLDGHAVFDALIDAAPGIDDPETATDWSGLSDPVTLLAADGATGFAVGPFRTAAEGFAEWYADLYAEPTPAEDAWDPDRMEYEARVSAGAGDEETVLAAGEYEGGRLDWYDFETDAGDPIRTEGPDTPKRTLADPPEDSDRPSTELPTKATFRGMPASRLWEMEDANVDLSAIAAAADDLARLFLLEFALIAGDDWFTLPVEAPVGSITRVSELTVTDTFGVTTDPVAPTTERADAEGWDMYTFDLPNHGAPGLFLPPVLGTSLSADPVEDVLFGRDEMANLVFGLERTVESGIGEPLDRTEFRDPSLVVASVNPAPDDLAGRAAADEESVVLRNEGDDALALSEGDLGGWTLRVTAPGESPETFDLGGIEVPAEDAVRIVIGGDAALDTDEVVHMERTAPVLLADATVHVEKPTTEGPGLVAVAPVVRDMLEGLDEYRLATEVEDHWFPYVPTTAADQTHRYELGLLLDADALSETVDRVPEPMGRILDPGACLYEEEVTRSGTRVTRAYQSSAWLDGTTYVWSGREVGPGTGEVSSGLRFDYLESEVPDSEE